MSRTVICHGCHTILGEGAHQGSVIGKSRCVLPHSLLCKGGISENESWRACPAGYVYNPDVEVQSYTGFTDTLDPSVFHNGALRRSTPAGSNQSLNAIGGQTLTNGINLNGHAQESGLTNSTERERLIRLRRQANGEGAFSKSTVVDSQPSHGLQGAGSAPVGNSSNGILNHNTSDPGLADLPLHIMDQIRKFRASNQQANEMIDRQEDQPDFNITHLRSDKNLREQVDSGLNSIRKKNSIIKRCTKRRKQKKQSDHVPKQPGG